MRDIKVSVVVPVYKVPLEYLRVCLDSLAAQTLQECEFIVVSDGAPEAECSICEEYANKDSRFKYFRREHAGVSVTRNFGIEQAQGEYISFVDSDDYVKQNYLSFLSQLQISPDIIFFNFSFQFQDPPFSVVAAGPRGRAERAALVLLKNAPGAEPEAQTVTCRQGTPCTCRRL